MIKKELAAFVITFNRPALLLETIRILSKQSVSPCMILVVNNGSPLDGIENAVGHPDIRLKQHVMGINAGPAGAANWALRHLASEGYEWIQWVDDDDPPKVPDLNERLFQHLGKLGQYKVGVISASGSYFNERSGIAVRVPNRDIENNKYLFAQTVGGNQCMIINSSVVKDNCFPSSHLFFGFEETNFCLKVLKADYKIIVPCDLFREYRNIAGRWNLTRSDIRKTDIPFWRTYYSTRNLIFMFGYEFCKPATVLRIICRSLLKSVYITMSKGPLKGSQSFYYTVLAIKDGLFKRTGLTIKPLYKPAGLNHQLS